MRLGLEQLVLAIASAILLLVVAFIIYKRRPKKLKNTYFISEWRELQQHCKTRSNWPLALKEADFLLDKALKKRRYKGKTTGARLMAAQRAIKDNDGVWFAHNLTKKTIETLDAEGTFKLAKADVKEALEAYQAALVDLGALKRG